MRETTIKETKICKEYEEEFYNKWFSQKKRANFIFHVDTLYYMVIPDVKSWNNEPDRIEMIDDLSKAKDKSRKIGKPISIYKDIDSRIEVEPFFSSQMYSLHFGIKDYFDVFVCEIVPNEKTPPIMVQIRSQSLWINGIKNSIDKSSEVVERVLAKYGISIKELQENRIDYAFHTNYINNFINFFPECDLKEMQVSNFARWQKQGDFYDSVVNCDYFTLGRNKSNNVFIRAYNKTKEVIEMGYKQFFIAIWEHYGLINEFDKWVLERTFKHGNYEAKDKIRCEFYYNFGKDEDLKREIYEHIKYSDTPLSWYTKTAKGLVPDITLITNFEIQTKRKFYDRLQMPVITKNQTYKKRLYNIMEQMKPITDFITQDTIRFVKYKGEYAEVDRTKRPNADWWDRLRSAKSVEIKEHWIIDYIRKYQHDLDFERFKNLTLHKLAKMGAYNSIEISEFSKITIKDLPDPNNPIYGMVNDYSSFMSGINDNDLQKYYAIRTRKLSEIKKRFGE